MSALGARHFGITALSAVVAAVTVGATEGPAEAQASTPDISLRADADELEIGDHATITLSAMSDSTTPQPADPTLVAPPGWSVTGPMTSTQTQMSIINGRIAQRSGFRAVWILVPTKTGNFEIGPVTLSVSGKRVKAGTLKMTVRPPGGRTKPRRRPQANDPFGGLFGGLLGPDDPMPAPAPEPTADAQLSMDVPLEPLAFLRTIADKPTAVVGEQVTLSIYLYTQPRVYQVVDPHEPTAVDFVQRVLSNGENEAKIVNVGGSRWTAQLIRRVALFPLKAGALTVGPMTLTLLGQGLRGGGVRGGMTRASFPFAMEVKEPPPGPRPAGYIMGDVGSFSLQAMVEPRQVETGGTVAVTAVLKGTGLVPATLRISERKGVSWLEPDTKENTEMTQTEVLGARSFLYLVRLAEPGKINLGELSVSFWNPKLKEYQTARAPLGLVEVKGVAAPAASVAIGSDPFAAVGPARTTAVAYSTATDPITEHSWFWGGLVGAPIGVLGLGLASEGWRRARAARAARADSTKSRAQQALGEADEAEAKGDRKAAASAVERAVVHAVEGATGVKLRALMREEIEPSLVAAGLPAEAAAEVASLLLACDAWRFEPDAAGEEPGPVARARALVKRLGGRS